MLDLVQDGSAIRVETMGGILTWEAERGGQLSGLVVKDDLHAHCLLGDGGMVTDLRLTLDGRGRPLQLPEDRDECRRAIASWVEAHGMYPDLAAVAV